ncbi:MAG: hypothetical protein U0R78_05380 [Nocardioidaceae bacterium]
MTKVEQVAGAAISPPATLLASTDVGAAGVGVDRDHRDARTRLDDLSGSR